MTVLTAATNQWASRPADQRFASLESLHERAMYYEQQHRQQAVDLGACRIAIGQSGQPVMLGPSGGQADFTHWSFGQVCRKLSAPANYLRELPSELVQANLNHSLQKLGSDERDAVLHFGVNGSRTLRAMVSDRYKRIRNVDVTSRLLRLVQQQPEWQPAPAAFDGSRGLYLSDRDMFAFMVDNDRQIFAPAPEGRLGRGFFVENSEVGDASFSVTTFFYEYICGNHRVWGASGVHKISIRHVGNADSRAFGQLAIELRKYADSSASQDEAKLAACVRFTLGASKDEVLDRVFNLGVSRKLAAQAYTLAELREDWYGNPRSAWGYTGALTEIARDLPNADERVTLERTAGKIMQLAF